MPKATVSKMIVEMQNRYQTHFADRALYYLSVDVYGQGKKGEGWDYKLTPVYGIFLMNFEWRDKEEQHIREDICLYNMQKKRIFSEKMRMTFLKIPMMDKVAEECKTTLERWLYILKNMEKMEAIPQTFMTEPVFKRLGKVARFAALDKEQQAAYRASLKVYRDNYAILKTEREEGFAEGEAKGLAQGRAEGFAEGKAEGRAEAKEEERINTMHMLKDSGISIEKIAEIYKLSETEVERLLYSR